MKKLLIIDGLNMFLRKYIVNPALAHDGHPIGGCIGFIKSLQKVCGMFSPDEIIIAWDGHSGSSKRKEMNKGYKDGRKPVFQCRFQRGKPPSQPRSHTATQPQPQPAAAGLWLGLLLVGPKNDDFLG